MGNIESLPIELFSGLAHSSAFLGIFDELAQIVECDVAAPAGVI